MNEKEISRTVKIDDDFNEDLIAPFFSSLQGLSGDKIDLFSESLMKGGNLDILVKKKHGLILLAFMDKNMKKIQIGIEAEQALDLIYEMYNEEIEKLLKNIPIDLSIFKKFEILLSKQIQEYYAKVDQTKSLFSKLIQSFKKKPGEIR